jgi:hypothetical protein
MNAMHSAQMAKCNLIESHRREYGNLPQEKEWFLAVLLGQLLVGLASLFSDLLSRCHVPALVCDLTPSMQYASMTSH